MKHTAIFSLVLLFVALATQAAFAQTNTTFTYQGRLTDNSTLASGAYDLQFALFDAVSDGTQQGASVTLSNVAVTNGIFTVALDFGSAPFATGAPRFLQIGVRPGGSSSAFTLLTPRQSLAPTPYAIHALQADTAGTATNATNATNATQLGGVEANQYVTGAVVRNVNGLSGNVTLAAGANVTLTPSGNTLTIAATGGGGGTGNFIQNGTTPQANANFNISGNGTVGGVLVAGAVHTANITASTFVDAPQYNMNGVRILSDFGFNNLFAGADVALNNTGQNNAFFGRRAGASNTDGSSNSFFGSNAGAANSSGVQNSFFGSLAGIANTANGNSFFGYQAGANNTTGSQNAAFGLLAGVSNATGGENAFFGSSAGFSTRGDSNAFFGANAGRSNLFGSFNTLIGRRAGENVTSGSGNVFIGNDTGAGNTTGSSNTLLGSGANSTNSLAFATAIGAGAFVSTSNSVVLGRSADTVRIPGRLSISLFGLSGGSSLCINASNEVSFCSSSRRYKTDISPYRNGLDFIKRLEPVRFTWKDGGMRDLGFVAEDVAAIDPLLALYKDGRVEGVKYDRLSAVLVNAVKEQQAQIEAQQKQIAELKTQLAQLRPIVCVANPSALLCQPVR